MTFTAFRKTIKEYYKAHKRDFPWRETKDPYNSFLNKFPTAEALAKAKLSDVLAEWQGLGYNRRALYLKQCAEKVVSDFGGKFPKDFNTLVSLPGIGPATAGDVMVFSWNIPMVVIETNIRSVFIHFFFKDKKKVTDKEILPLIEKTLDTKNPREWYWALFDYGTFLKKTSNPSRRSAHHTKQTKFVGSFRQKRAIILREILEKPQNQKDIVARLGYEKSVVSKIISDLEKEGFIKKVKTGYMIV
jgi:A/G-specific adenine glycosylase